MHWIFWNLNTCQIIVIHSHLNEISIISSIASHHEFTQSLLVIYLFIILKKVKKIKERIEKVGNHYQWIDFHVAVASKFDPSAMPNKKQRKIGIQELRLGKIVVDLTWSRGYWEVVKTNTWRKKAQSPFLY